MDDRIMARIRTGEPFTFNDLAEAGSDANTGWSRTRSRSILLVERELSAGRVVYCGKSPTGGLVHRLVQP